MDAVMLLLLLLLLLHLLNGLFSRTTWVSRHQKGKSFWILLSDVITLFRPCVPPPVAFPKAPFLVPCFSSCTLPLSALSSPPFHSITTFMQMTPNCFSHSTKPTSIHALPTFRMPFSKSLPG